MLKIDVCTDCLMVIANGEFEAVAPEVAAAVARGIHDMHAEGYMVALENTDAGHFSWSDCDLCQTKLGGDRWPAVLVPLAAIGSSRSLRAESRDVVTSTN